MAVVDAEDWRSRGESVVAEEEDCQLEISSNLELLKLWSESRAALSG